MEHYARLIDIPVPVLAMVYRAHAELLYDGKTDVLHLQGDEHALCTYEDGVQALTACLLWRESEPGEWWTQLGWVRQDHRRRGLYRQLWEELLVLAAQHEVKTIIGGTAYTNRPMQAVMEKMGRKPFAIMYRYDI